MSDDQREQLRISLLRFCAANTTRWGCNLALLNQMGRNEGRDWLGRDETEQEVQYLVDKGLLQPCGKIFSPECRAWRLHADGRDWLAERKIT